MNLAYYNGIYEELTKICIPVSDRSIMLADAIYDVFSGANGHFYQFDEHYERLKNNAIFLNLNCPEKDIIFNVASTLVSSSNLSTYMIYVQLSRDLEIRNHSYPDGAKTNLLVTVSEISIPQTIQTTSVMLLPDRRYDYCHIKTVNLLPAVLASKAAEKNGYEEAAFYLSDDTVTECSRSNIFMCRDEAIYTHPLTNKVLPGIMRENVKTVAKKLHIPFFEVSFTTNDIKKADALFISSTTKFIRKVTKISGIGKIASVCDIPEAIFCKIRDDFAKKIGI